MDTADTGDTGDTGRTEEQEIVSAAEQAGETGGFSCSANMASPSLVLALISIGLLIIYRRA